MSKDNIPIVSEKMGELDKKIESGAKLTYWESTFYNNSLPLIQEYYSSLAQYWNNKTNVSHLKSV